MLTVLDLKDAFHLLRLSENSNDIVEYYNILVAPHICIKECLQDEKSQLQSGNHILMQY